MKEIKLELPIVDLSGVCESMNELKKAVEEYGKRNVIVRLGTALIKSGVKCSAIIEGSDEEVILDFSEHDKMVTDEKIERLESAYHRHKSRICNLESENQSLKRKIEDLEAIIADEKKPDISVSENGFSIGCECGGYHLAKARIAELEEKLKNACCENQQLKITVDVLSKRIAELMEVHEF